MFGFDTVTVQERASAGVCGELTIVRACKQIRACEQVRACKQVRACEQIRACEQARSLPNKYPALTLPLIPPSAFGPE